MVEYVRTYLSHGYTKEHLADHLRRHGWSDEYISWAFTHADHVPVRQAPHAHQAQQGQYPAAQQAGHPDQQGHHAPAKYGLFRAIADTWKATAHNPAAMVMAMVLTLVLGAAGMFLIGIVITALIGALYLSASFVVTLWVTVAVTLVLSGFLYSFLGAFLVNMLAQALADGIHSRKSSLAAIIRLSFARLVRVWTAGLQLLARVYGVYVAGIVACLPIAIFSPFLGILFMLLAAIAGLVWAIIMGLRYAVVAMVAFFEPNLSIKQCFPRSYHLMAGGGQWFVAKAVLLWFGVSFVLQLVAGGGKASEAAQVVVGLASVIMGVFATGVLVMLYLNRRAVKG